MRPGFPTLPRLRSPGRGLRNRLSVIALARALLAGLLLAGATGAAAAPDVRTVTIVETRREHNRRVLNTTWEWVNSHYFDASFHGLDWTTVRASHLDAAEAAADEEELYAVLKRMVGELGDHHSQVLSPREVGEQGRVERTLLGFVSRPSAGAADTWTIVGVMPGSPAESAGVRPGWILSACDGLPPAQVLGTGRSLEDGRPVLCEFSDEDARVRTLAIAAGEVESRVVREARLLEGGRLYLRFDEFDSVSVSWLRGQLRAHPGASGVVLDLRFNPGGEIAALEEIAGEFFAEPTLLGSLVSRDGEASEIVSRRADDAATVRGRIAVLVSGESMSCAEILACALQLHDRGLVLGARTAGMVLGTVGIPLPGGGELQLSVWDYRAPDGRRLEREGVLPDIALGHVLGDPRSGLRGGIDAAVVALDSGSDAIAPR